VIGFSRIVAGCFMNSLRMFRWVKIGFWIKLSFVTHNDFPWFEQKKPEKVSLLRLSTPDARFELATNGLTV